MAFLYLNLYYYCFLKNKYWFIQQKRLYRQIRHHGNYASMHCGYFHKCAFWPLRVICLFFCSRIFITVLCHFFWNHMWTTFCVFVCVCGYTTVNVHRILFHVALTNSTNSKHHRTGTNSRKMATNSPLTCRLADIEDDTTDVTRSLLS